MINRLFFNVRTPNLWGALIWVGNDSKGISIPAITFKINLSHVMLFQNSKKNLNLPAMFSLTA